jgi:hypothetical protein
MHPPASVGGFLALFCKLEPLLGKRGQVLTLPDRNSPPHAPAAGATHRSSSREIQAQVTMDADARQRTRQPRAQPSYPMSPSGVGLYA